MDLNEVKEIARKTMISRRSHLQREKGYIFYHCERVGKSAVNLRKLIFPEQTEMDEIIYTGGQFHDVTKGIEPHNHTGSVMVKELLHNVCSEFELEKISEIVRCHNQRERSEYPFYIKLVQDADILDHLGSQEIWLKFMFSAYEDESVFDAINWWSSEEYKKYHSKVRKALNYDISKKIFDEKEEFEKHFAERFLREANGEYILGKFEEGKSIM